MTPVSGVVDRDLGFDRILKDLIRSNGAEVYVGIRQEKGAELVPDESGKYDVTLAAVATWNEFGTEDGHVPSRSFLRDTVDLEQNNVQKRLADGIGQVMEGKATLEDALGLVGLHVVRASQARISQGIAPENAPSTIAKKGSSKPLVGETGRLRASIEFEVRIQGEQTGEGGST